MADVVIFPLWSDELKDQYFEYLYRFVGGSDIPHRGYRFLLQVLQDEPFIWTVPNDNDRVQDGLLLRKLFFDDYDIYDFETADSHTHTCSVFELLVGLVLRMEEIIAEPLQPNGELRPSLFMELLNNLELTEYTDRGFSTHDRVFVEHKLKFFLNRTYDRDGKGGIFPLIRSRMDQRNVELWYQMNQYIDENYMYEV